MFSLKKLLIFLFVFIFSSALYCQEFIQGQTVYRFNNPYLVVYSTVIKKNNEIHEIAQLRNSFGDEQIISIRTVLNPDGTCNTRNETMYDLDEAITEDFFFGLAFAPITIPVQIAMLPVRFLQSKRLKFPHLFMFKETKRNIFAKVVVSLGLAKLLEKYL